MAVNRFNTVADIINQVAVEVAGLTPVEDPFATNDTSFLQLRFLLTAALQEMMELHEWQILVRSWQFTTVQGETGDYALPADFGYMINQTGWERNENVPLVGPLSAQDWTYLLGRDLVGSTIYASFRFDQDQFKLFPNQPVTANLDINLEYISRNLIQKAGSDPVEYTDKAEAAADIVLFPPNLVTRYLKVKFQEAKGLDSTAARGEFYRAFNGWAGRETGAKLLNAGRKWRGFPYLDAWNNLPDTRYGNY